MWFHVRSATFSPLEDVVYRSMLCTWDVKCRKSQVLKLDQLFLEHSVAYARDISSLGLKIKVTDIPVMIITVLPQNWHSIFWHKSANVLSLLTE